MPASLSCVGNTMDPRAWPREGSFGLVRSAELAALRAGAWLLGELPDHLGQFRLAQWYWWRRRPDHRFLSQRMVDGTVLELDLGDRTQALAYLTRRYSEDLIREIVSRLPVGGVFFDVGSNVGLVTFQVAQRRPDARIVAFEANPAAVAGWRRNRRLSTSDAIAVEPTAVSARDGVVTVQAPSIDLGAGRIKETGDGEPVRATALDAYCDSHDIDRIDVLKVDVEGSEPDVLEGSRGLLISGRIRALIIELNDVYLERRRWDRAGIVNWLAAYRMVPVSPLDRDDVAFVVAA